MFPDPVRSHHRRTRRPRLHSGRLTLLAAVAIAMAGADHAFSVQPQSQSQNQARASSVSPATGSDRVTLRRDFSSAPDAEPHIVTGRIVQLDDGGIILDPGGGGNLMVVTWDRVRDIESPDPNRAREWSQRHEMAEAMWRGRSRLERGDHGGAALIFADLFDAAAGRTDGSALVIAEGLLRSRIALGQRLEAVIPWLETLRLREAGVTAEAYGRLPAIIDASTGLCWDLPPVFETEASVADLIDDLFAYAPEASAAVKDLSRVYLLAAAQASPLDRVRRQIGSGVNPAAMDELILKGEAGRPWFTAEAPAAEEATADGDRSGAGGTGVNPRPRSRPLPAPRPRSASPGGRGEDPAPQVSGVALVSGEVMLPELRTGVRIAAALVASGDARHASVRNAAVSTLTRYVDDERVEPALVAWAYFGRGRARAMSIDTTLQQLGLLDLLMLPARHAATAPRLTRLALREALPKVEAMTSPAAVDSMLQEFNRAWPRYALTRSEVMGAARRPNDADAETDAEAGDTDGAGAGADAGPAALPSRLHPMTLPPAARSTATFAECGVALPMHADVNLHFAFLLTPAGVDA